MAPSRIRAYYIKSGFSHSLGQKLTVNGATLQIVLVNGFTPSAGQTFPILQWALESGTFGSVDISLAVLPAGLSWDVSGLKSGVEAVKRSTPASVAVPLPVWSMVLLQLLLLLANLSLWLSRNRYL
jgi:hypothetical protein